MVDAVTRTCRHLLWLLFVLPSAGLAHQLDEYIQATLVAIEPGEIRLQMNLTPGVQVASQVLAVVDRDRNGVISTNEAVAYAEAVRKDLVVRLDGRSVTLKLNASNFPAVNEIRDGLGIIQIEFSVTPGSFLTGPHTLTVEDHHLLAISAYLVNAARPKSALIQITGQKRNETQSFGEVDFNFSAPAKPAHDSDSDSRK
jgi:hypothetical protein